MEKILIIGAGSGGRLISQFIKESSFYEIVGFIDDSKSLQGRAVNGYRVIAACGQLKKFKGFQFLVSVGTDLAARRQLFEKAKACGLIPAQFIHRNALIDISASLGSGTIVLAGCVINPFVEVGSNCFIFSSTVIEHECKIGDNVYLSPGVRLAGGVRVASNTFFGIGSCVIEGVKIGSNVTVGAGAVVLKDVISNTVVAGVPAKEIRKK